MKVHVPSVEQLVACDAHTTTGMEQHIACGAHTKLGGVRSATVPPGDAALLLRVASARRKDETECVGCGVAAKLEDLAIKLRIANACLPSLHGPKH